MPTAEKEALVQEVTERLTGAKSLYLADFSGMTVAKVTALRAKCRASGVHYKVVKTIGPFDWPIVYRRFWRR